MVGVGAQAHVGDDHQVGHPGLEGTHSLLHHAVIGVGGGGHGILLIGDAKQQHATHAGLVGSAGLLHHQVGREPGNSRQRVNRLADSLTGDGEHGQHQL